MIRHKDLSSGNYDPRRGLVGVWPPLWRGLTSPSALNTLTWIGLVCRLDLCDYFSGALCPQPLYPTNLSLCNFCCSWVGSIKSILKQNLEHEKNFLKIEVGWCLISPESNIYSMKILYVRFLLQTYMTGFMKTVLNVATTITLISFRLNPTFNPPLSHENGP